MPFVSKAQVRKFDHLLREGKITKEQYDQWHAETPNIKKLPARVKKKKSVKKGFAHGFKKVASSFFNGLLKSNVKPAEPATTQTIKNVKLPKAISERAVELARKKCTIKDEGRIDGAIKRYNAKILEKMRTAAGKVVKEASPILAEEAHTQSQVNMADAVPGQDFRDSSDTGQPGKKNARTGVQNEDKQFSRKLKVKYDSSRAVRR